MSDITIEDLRVDGRMRFCHDDGSASVYCPDPLPLTPAELAELIESMGYVKRPVCGECGGKGVISNAGLIHNGDPINPQGCPSCGGTGFGRLVALDGIDVRKLREDLHMLEHAASPIVRQVARFQLTQLLDRLAAIDQEAT